MQLRHCADNCHPRVAIDSLRVGPWETYGLIEAGDRRAVESRERQVQWDEQSRWRITEMELWDTDFVDMLEPAYITFEANGGGEFVFGAVRGGLASEKWRVPDEL